MNKYEKVWLKAFCKAVSKKTSTAYDAKEKADYALRMFKERFPEPKEISKEVIKI